MRHILGFALGVGLFVAGCKVGPDLDDIRPEAALQFADSTQVQDSAMVAWWEMFDDPVMDTLVMQALRNNKDAGIAAARVTEARAALGFTKADVWPRFSYSASLAINDYGLFGNQPIELFVGGVGMTWEIDFWGKFRRANEAAREELLASTYGFRAVQVSLISEVMTQYLTLLDFQWRLELSRKTLASRDSGVFIVQAKFDRGVVPEIDLNQAQIQRAIAAAAVPFYERKVVETQNSLSVLLGENPRTIPMGKMLADQEVVIPIPVGMPSLLLRRRPDILQAERAVYAQNARVGVAVAQRFPSFSLTGLLGFASPDLANFTSGGLAWSAGADLLGPLFFFGKNKRRVEVEKARTEQALLSYENTVIKAFAEVQNALVTVKTYELELQARLENVNAANNALYLSNQRYSRGVTSYLEVLEQQRAAFDAGLQYAQTRQLFLSSHIALYKALGGGWITDAERQEATQP